MNASAPVLAPTATKIPADADGRVVICGSHGGAYAGYLVIRSGAHAFMLNDAGVGLDNAGIGSLDLAQSIGMAAVTVACDSARIGEADDMLAQGLLSHCNPAAEAAGCREGMTCAEAARHLAVTPPANAEPPAYSEARFDQGVNPHGLRIVCIDSVSLVDRAADVGQIVVSGSHGGVVGGKPELALQVDARAGFYNDAGVGKDGAGITRLAALDQRTIIAGVVSARSARIGDGRSTLNDGILSYVNETAASAGLTAGMALNDAVTLIKPTT